MATELGSSQISSLLESLPGIAHVLRSPVADALVGVIRAAARIGELRTSDVDELVKYATRRGLLGQDEGDRLLADVNAAVQKRLDKAADRAKAHKPKPKPKAKTVKAVKSVKPVKGAKKAAKTAKRR